MKKIIFLLSCFTILSSCRNGYVFTNYPHHIQAQPISLNNAQLTNCVFNPIYRIVHFPMYHVPPSGVYNATDFETIARSQFQLLRTIISYKGRIAVFDEHINTDRLNESFFQTLKRGYATADYTISDGRRFFYQDQFKKTYNLFGKGIPTYYEHLTLQQKNLLLDAGASLVLFYLGIIPAVYKVINEQDYNLVKANALDENRQVKKYAPDGQKNYWVYDFREKKLKEKVLDFYRKNPGYRGLILIAFGSSHDFSNNFQGYAFQSGHFCMNWLSPSEILP